MGGDLEEELSELPRNISELHLISTGITVITDQAFQGLTALKSLMVTENAFKGLQLEKISCGSNSVTTISPFTIVGSTLINLGLYGNEIKFIPRKMIAKFRVLKLLNLSKNPLLQIPDFSEISLDRLPEFTVKLLNISLECCPTAAILKQMKKGFLDDFLCSNTDLESMSWSNITTNQLKDLHCSGE